MKFAKLADSYGLVLTVDTPEEFLALGRAGMHEKLNEHGILLFRSSRHIDRDSFIKISQMFSHLFVIHGAKVRKPVTSDGTVQTVTEGPGAIVLHSEMHFSPFAPDYIWFFCETAPSVGGETTVCDGELFFQNLSARAQSLLRAQRLRYWNLWDVEVWQKYFSGCTRDEVIAAFAAKGAKAWFNAEGELEFEALKSALTLSKRGQTAFVNSIAVHSQYHANLKMFEAQGQESRVRHRISFEDGSAIPEWLLQEIVEVERQLVLPLKWTDGDLALLDNNRVLHGRREFDPSIKRSILVRMAMAS